MKSRVGPRLGFKRFGNATVVTTGLDLAHTLRMGPFTVNRLVDLWRAVRAA